MDRVSAFWRALLNLGRSRFDELLKPADNTSNTLLFRLFQIAIVAASIVLAIDLIFHDDQGLGPFGDFFGGVLNPILTFLTFMGLLVTIVLQQTELRETRVELKRSADALELQIKAVSSQNFQATFFQMLALLNTMVSSMDIQRRNLPTIVGRDCFKFFYEQLNTYYRCDTNYKSSIDCALAANDKLWTEYRQDLSHYYRYLYNIIRLVKESDVDDVKYTRIIRSQLSDYEFAILFYNGLTPKAKSFKSYIEASAFFVGFPQELLLSQSHATCYHEGAYTEHPVKPDAN